MGTENTGPTLTKSQATSAYFQQDSGYDKDVYENTRENWVKIVGMLILFYIVQFLHWWANFELGITASTTSTIYNLIIFGSAVLVIGVMLLQGATVNRKKLTHEFYQEKISEENLRMKDLRAKQVQKEKEEAKKAGNI